MTRAELERARRLLCSLHDHVRAGVISARSKGLARMSRVSGITPADTIYAVDRTSEKAILGWFRRNWPARWPVELVMEGLETPVTFPPSTPVADTLYKCILDPIDGTRCIMYDKRSAWILTGLAPQKGAANRLSDLFLAVMTEIPTTKQWRSDQLSAIRGAGRAGFCASSYDCIRRRRSAFDPKPSGAVNFRHGFASFVRFFPAGKELTARIEEKLWATLDSRAAPDSLVFDDQYMSTGGQLYELITGRDRMVADLRPAIFSKLKLKSQLTCHPYDICTALILTELGGIIEAPDGEPLDAPLDTLSPVGWVGYANPRLAKRARPVLKDLLRLL